MCMILCCIRQQCISFFVTNIRARISNRAETSIIISLPRSLNREIELRRFFLISILSLISVLQVFASPAAYSNSPPGGCRIAATEVIDSVPNRSRVLITSISHAALWTGSFIALNQAWYKDFPRSSFQFFNDNAEWLQMDKAGHIWSTYQMARVSAACWQWAGIDPNKSATLGAISAMAFQSIIEIQDGFSEQWGFSVGDMIANFAGAATLVAQQRFWNEQRVQVKFSFYPQRYPASLRTRSNEIFGAGVAERMLKDYNAQTYWISVNPSSFMKQSRFPAWLNISVGYGVEGVLGARSNIWTDENGIEIRRTDIDRVRRFYLAPDLDLTRIKTNSRFLRTALFVLNAVKIPAPALELNSRGKLRVHAVKF